MTSKAINAREMLPTYYWPEAKPSISNCPICRKHRPNRTRNTPTHDHWEEFLSRGIGFDIGMGVCPTGKGADFVLLRRILPLGLRIVGVENGQPAWVFEGEGTTNLVEKLTE